jgi:hypothetical protein
MTQQSSNSDTSHFHIYWHGEDSLYRERFNSFQEAISRAIELARADKILRIEQFSENCPRCAPKSASAN